MTAASSEAFIGDRGLWRMALTQSQNGNQKIRPRTRFCVALYAELFFSVSINERQGGAGPVPTNSEHVAHEPV
jgi:hypothetical protein